MKKHYLTLPAACKPGAVRTIIYSASITVNSELPWPYRRYSNPPAASTGMLTAYLSMKRFIIKQMPRIAPEGEGLAERAKRCVSSVWLTSCRRYYPGFTYSISAAILTSFCKP